MRSGAVDDIWDIKADAAKKHGEFYQHTLGQYLRYFSGRTATYVTAEQPAATGPDAFTVLRRALGFSDDLAEGDAVRLPLPGLHPVDAVVDYLRPQFIGLRTADGLYRFYDRSTWGWPIRLGHHLFANDVDQENAEKAWRVCVDEIFA